MAKLCLLYNQSTAQHSSLDVISTHLFESGEIFISGALDGCKKMREAGADKCPDDVAEETLKKSEISKLFVPLLCFPWM